MPRTLPKKTAPVRPARIVTVCAQGRDPKSSDGQALRLRDIEAVGRQLRDWGPVDAVLFPGGFLFEKTKIAARLIDGLPADSVPALAARTFFTALNGTMPAAQLILGVDTSPYSAQDRIVGGQQLALAFNRDGLSGFARKIFPIDEDTDGKTMPPLIIHEKDFSDPRRIITLANGSRALLNVCYDMFGVASAARDNPSRLRRAGMVEDRDGRLHYKPESSATLRRAFTAYREMLAQQQPAIALAAIHRFAAPGRERFWQRHGIAAASAGLRAFNQAAGFAVGAAHVGKLPADPAMIRLMANNVPLSHLTAGGQRRAHAGFAERFMVSTETLQDRPRWMARLYMPAG